jgi:hypothetical protein
VSFPWGIAITAASTLIAGWGGISLKDWHDARRARQDRRRAAYLEFMLRLDDLRRLFGAPRTLDEQALSSRTIGKAMGQAVGEIQRAYFNVFLVAPRNVQVLAGAAWDAAWKIHDWFDSGGPSPADLSELEKRVTEFGQKSTAFAAVARAAEGGYLPTPIAAGTGEDPAGDGKEARQA